MALTKRDLQLIRQLVKEEVKKEISTEVSPFKNEMYEFRSEMYEFRSEIKNDLLQFKDDILHEIIGMREDVAVLTGWRGILENHEERLGTVEVKLGIPQA
ncbi:MAG: hypothetical protein ABII10_02090 [Candidatus Paceibacterota bacterium]